MTEHDARKALAMAMDHVQQDSKTAALLMSAGFPEPKQLSHMDAIFLCKRHGVMISQMPEPEEEVGVTTTVLQLSRNDF